MSRHNWTDHSLRPHTKRREESLTEKRFEELLKSASSFFAEAEEHSAEERQAVIFDIVALMEKYGLKVEDLQ